MTKYDSARKGTEIRYLFPLDMVLKILSNNKLFGEFYFFIIYLRVKISKIVLKWMHNLKVFSRTIVRKYCQVYTYISSEKTMKIEQTSSSRACSLHFSTPIHRLRQLLRPLWCNKRGTEWPSFYGKRDFVKKTR